MNKEDKIAIVVAIACLILIWVLFRQLRTDASISREQGYYDAWREVNKSP